MFREILLSSNNEGKILRYQSLLKRAEMNVVLHTPRELGIPEIAVEEAGQTLAENAELKVRAYFGKTHLPILSNDTGFWVEGEGLVVTPKRSSLNGRDAKELSKAEIAESMIAFWKNIARAHGGRVAAAWIEEFALLTPGGELRRASSRREVILTDTMFGESHMELPVRALYISKATGKPAVRHTPEEELLELQPNIDALRKVFA